MLTQYNQVVGKFEVSATTVTHCTAFQGNDCSPLTDTNTSAYVGDSPPPWRTPGKWSLRKSRLGPSTAHFHWLSSIPGQAKKCGYGPDHLFWNILWDCGSSGQMQQPMGQNGNRSQRAPYDTILNDDFAVWKSGYRVERLTCSNFNWTTNEYHFGIMFSYVIIVVVSPEWGWMAMGRRWLLLLSLLPWFSLWCCCDGDDGQIFKWSGHNMENR